MYKMLDFDMKIRQCCNFKYELKKNVNAAKCILNKLDAYGSINNVHLSK